MGPRVKSSEWPPLELGTPETGVQVSTGRSLALAYLSVTSISLQKFSLSSNPTRKEMGYERGHCYSLLLYTWALQIVTESESPVNSVGKPGVRAQSSSPGTQLPLPLSCFPFPGSDGRCGVQQREASLRRGTHSGTIECTGSLLLVGGWDGAHSHSYALDG